MMIGMTTMQVFIVLLWITLLEGFSTSSTDLSALCQQLETNFSNTILPSDSEYVEVSEEHWSQTAWKKPACIFRPESVDEVQTVLPQLVAGNISFAIRSGGHLPSPGAANIDEGVLIDLCNLDHIEYDAANSLVSVGMGNKWVNVYTELDRYNVTVVGGRVYDVGVGGLTLGNMLACKSVMNDYLLTLRLGGLSYLSDLYGLVCDNVVSFEIVLANGSVIQPSADAHSDLFWALKGGSNNFGMVTSMVLNTYPLDQIWAGVKGYTLDKTPALFDALLEYQSTPNKDPYANLMIQGFATNSTLGVTLSVIYLKPEESPEAFLPFYNIPTVYDTTRITTLNKFLGSQGNTILPRIDQRATSFKPDASLYKKIVDIVTKSPQLENIQSVPAGSQAFGIQPISSSLVEAGQVRGGNALGLEAVNQTWLVLTSGWWSIEDDETLYSATREMIDDIEAASKEDDQYIEYIFMNDADWDQNVIRHYGESSVERLRGVQRQYDSDSVFQRLVPGGFKLP